MEPVAAAVPDRLHALDRSPVNSKIVVIDEGAMLATGEGVTLLPSDDPASTLPHGARIQKTAEGEYVSNQLGDNAPAWVTTTATDAIAGFLAHFHGR